MWDVIVFKAQTASTICLTNYAAPLWAGVAACGEGQGTGDLGNLFSPPGPHVHGHDLHQQGPAAHDRLRHPVQQEQVGEMAYGRKEMFNKTTLVAIVKLDDSMKLMCLCPPCSFGMIPTSPLPIHTPLMPSQSIEISLPLNTIGPVMKMDPLNNLQVLKNSIRRKQILWSTFTRVIRNSSSFFLLTCTQVAVKNSIDVFYFSVLIPLNIFFVEDGKMGMSGSHTPLDNTTSHHAVAMTWRRRRRKVRSPQSWASFCGCKSLSLRFKNLISYSQKLWTGSAIL